MKELDINSWKEFEEKLTELESYRNGLLGKTSDLHVSDFLFRGVPNSKWGLTTTLERFTHKKVSLTQYYKFAHRAKSKIETFTEKKWEILTPPQFENWIRNQTHISFINMPGYEYLAYLRHHGYPSPLLDWTFSPYIAMFFAFRNILSNVDYVSIYVYLEYAGGVKVVSSNTPYIQTFGPYATINKRHFLQQSAYTVCTIREKNDFIFTQHDQINNINLDQDIIWKLNLPSSERLKVLHKLNKMNINAYSLFLSIDSLMEATAISENILER